MKSLAIVEDLDVSKILRPGLLEEGRRRTYETGRHEVVGGGVLRGCCKSEAQSRAAASSGLRPRWTGRLNLPSYRNRSPPHPHPHPLCFDSPSPNQPRVRSRNWRSISIEISRPVVRKRSSDFVRDSMPGYKPAIKGLGFNC